MEAEGKPYRRRPLPLFVLILGLLSITGMGQHTFASEDEQTTKILIAKTERAGYDVFYRVTNGRAWVTLDKQAKITLLVGIDEGLILIIRKMMEDKRSPKSLQDALDCQSYYSVGGFRFSDFVDQIDVFYGDTANLRVPVIEAYWYILRRIKGATSQELSTAAADLRRAYNK